ncbi:type I polyketide synthase [Seiridium cupressi]
MAQANQLAPKSSRWAKTSAGAKAMFLDRLAKTRPTGALTVRVGHRLVEILRPRVAAMYASENPNARILEIGGGTDGCTEPVLRALGGDGTQTARERFGPWGQRVSYLPLDIEVNPVQQGFEEKSYDLIIAAQVLHATKNMSVTMRNVRRLLKDGGRLLMVEITKDWPAQHLIFGTLPGWWLSEELERVMSPNMSIDTWKGVLAASAYQASSVLLSTVVQEQQFHGSDRSVVLVYDPAVSGPPPTSWVRDLATGITKATGVNIAPVVSKLSEADSTNSVCIFMAGLNGTSYVIDESRFDAIKSLIVFSGGMMWVTSGSTIDCPVPENAMPVGLFRTFKTEDASRRLISLDLDPNRSPWDCVSSAILARVFIATFGSPAHPAEVEFVERGGTILVPRICRDDAENMAFASAA